MIMANELSIIVSFIAFNRNEFTMLFGAGFSSTCDRVLKQRKDLIIPQSKYQVSLPKLH